MAFPIQLASYGLNYDLWELNNMATGPMRVSVVIPCFNVEHHVAAAVRSVMQQTYSDIDVVAIDDGSTDGTVRELERLTELYPGAFRWVAGPKQGACAARNQGLAMTNGEYVQFLDADDTVLTDKLHRQMDLAVASGMPDLIVGDFRNVYHDDTEETIRGLGGDPWVALISTQLGTTSSNLFKRSALEAVGGWNVDQVSSQDYELMFRMLKNGCRVAWDPHVSSLVVKRVFGSISRTGQRENWLRYLDLRQAIRAYLRELDPIKYAKGIEETDQHIFMGIRVLSRFDHALAEGEFRKRLPADFIPARTTANTPGYIQMYKLLGFKAAERSALLFSYFKKARPAR